MIFIRKPFSDLLFKYYHGRDHPGKLRLFNWLLKLLGRPYIEIPYREKGRIFINPTNHPDDEIFKTGIYEKEVADALIGGLRQSDVFWDVGAHIGSYTLLTLMQNDKKPLKVIAFEPNPAIRRILELNLDLNGYGKKDFAIVCNLALSDRQKRSHLTIPCKENPGSAQFEGARSNGASS